MIPPPDSPFARLSEEPFVFDFFQAVRLLEAMWADRTPVGRQGPPEAEVVRFAAHPSVVFPPAALERFALPADGNPSRLVVNFFGLTGPNGVLPPVYTQWVAAQERKAGDPEARAFGDWLDLFTHRLLSLFYRAWAKYRLPVAFEAAGRTGRRDPITAAALSLIGLGTPGLADRLGADDPAAGVDDIALLRYANHFSGATRPADGLARLLADYFAIPVEVESFRGRWLAVDEANQTRLGRRGANERVGESVVVGRRVWDVASGIRVVVGPLDGPAFTGWLPGSPRLTVLAKLVRLYTRDELDFDVQLVLAPGAVPPLRLVRRGAADGRRLGWDTWVTRHPPDRSVGDVVLRRGALVPGGSGLSGCS